MGLLLLASSLRNFTGLRIKAQLTLEEGAFFDDPLISVSRLGVDPDSYEFSEGYSSDIAVCAAVSKDSDLGSYLARCLIGPHAFTLLHAAVALGHLDRIAALCDAGALLEAVDTRVETGHFQPFQQTPLGLACWVGNTAAVQLLVDRGANLTLPLMAAV